MSEKPPTIVASAMTMQILPVPLAKGDPEWLRTQLDGVVRELKLTGMTTDQIVELVTDSADAWDRLKALLTPSENS